MPTAPAFQWPAERTSPDVAWRPPAGTRVISADDHLVEPEHLWEERLPAAIRHRAPKYWRENGDYRLELEGRQIPAVFSAGLVDGREGMADQRLRLLDMDAEGLDAG